MIRKFAGWTILVAVLVQLAAAGEGRTGNKTGEKKDKYSYVSDDARKNPRQPLYTGSPTHRDIAMRALELATQSGFLDTSGISSENLWSRLEAGAYSEDFEMIPGTVGEHYPSPWDLGPDFDFNGLYPLSKIPNGSLIDDKSGWSRGRPHGYDPSTGFTWPGSTFTTVEWANAPENTFTWDRALSLYREGKKEEAYECLGHVLHLVADLSVPQHVRVVDHGMSLTTKNDGTLWNPDVATLIVDEYELALAGGVELPGVVTLIPNLSGTVSDALGSASAANLPHLSRWSDYLEQLARSTYSDSLVGAHFGAPAANGEWGFYRDDSGRPIGPTQYGITPPAKIDGRWTQVVLKSTADVNAGTILSEEVMAAMCRRFVPKAAEYSAGLLLHFLAEANNPLDVGDARRIPTRFWLGQNFPNPFNPSTTIRFEVDAPGLLSLRVFDVLGREVVTLLNGIERPGVKSVFFDATGLPSGVYYYRLQGGSFIQTKKLLLVR